MYMYPPPPPPPTAPARNLFLTFLLLWPGSNIYVHLILSVSSYNVMYIETKFAMYMHMYGDSDDVSIMQLF